MEKPCLARLLDVKYPIIMAPMFLVTNTRMMIETVNKNKRVKKIILNFAFLLNIY